MKDTVAIWQDQIREYSDLWQYSDEYPEKEILRSISFLLGNEKGNIFKDIIKQGERVVIKPNWVNDIHEYGFDMFSIITHSSILRAIVDLVYDASRGDVQITIADAPQNNCNFDNLLRVTNICKIQEYYWKKYRFDIQILDLRQTYIPNKKNRDFIGTSDRIKLQGDPNGYAAVNIGRDSAFVGFTHAERMYGADYNRNEIIEHHKKNKHEYLISKTVLNADTFISVPKLKVHKKVGTTLNAKGMVGINGDKNWVAHYKIGPPAVGGDEYPDEESSLSKHKSMMRRVLIDKLLAPQTRSGEILYSLLNSIYTKIVKPISPQKMVTPLTVSAGDWHGNDTAWRMTADLARIVMYADYNGILQDSIQRNFFSIIDGMIGGEKDGPLAPAPKACGIIIGGANLLSVDIVSTRLMGFDWQKIKYLNWLVENCPKTMDCKNPKHDIKIKTNVIEWERLMSDNSIQDLSFAPHPGWSGHIEIFRESNYYRQRR